MKQCRTVKGLIRAIKKGETATLKVWDIMHNHFVPGGAYLNLGEGRFASVGEQNWLLIRDRIVNEEGAYCKNLNKYTYYYGSKAA